MALFPNICDMVGDGDFEDVQVFQPGTLRPAAHWQGLQQLEKLALGASPIGLVVKNGLAGLGRLQKLRLVVDEDEICPTDVWRCRGLRKLKICWGRLGELCCRLAVGSHHGALKNMV